MTIAKRIVVTTDFSQLSLRAVADARQLALLDDAAVYLLHVVDPLVLSGDNLGGPASAAKDLAQAPELEANLHARLEAIAEEHLGGVRETSAHVVLRRDTASAIVDFADSRDADLIIIASHGRSGFKRILLGSVAERVVRHADRSVFVVMIPKGDREEDQG